MAHALVAVVVLSICCHSTAQEVAPAPSPGTTAQAIPLPATASDFLEAHNQARAAVGVGPLKWSEKLANATSHLVKYQRNKMNCQFTNLTSHKYGANQSWGGAAGETPRMVVDKWVKEKEYYNYDSNSCAPNHNCGLYTQVVWRNSSELGCAQATCKWGRQITLTVCFYNPPGNYIGERPY